VKPGITIHPKEALDAYNNLGRPEKHYYQDEK
jgi:hypothetical protein